jgi:hypothetical protein
VQTRAGRLNHQFSIGLAEHVGGLASLVGSRQQGQVTPNENARHSAGVCNC